jgi:hypothetical protein
MHGDESGEVPRRTTTEAAENTSEIVASLRELATRLGQIGGSSK